MSLQQCWILLCDRCGFRFTSADGLRREDTVERARALGWSIVTGGIGEHYCPACRSAIEALQAIKRARAPKEGS